MPRYDHPSKYYADDKDISDILDHKKFTQKMLLGLALDRGIALSPELPRETMRDHLSRMPFSWTQLRELLDVIETAESLEKETICQCSSSASEDELQKILSDLRDVRGETAGESYVFRRVDSTVVARVIYRDVDHTQTRVMQRVYKEMEIVISPIEGGYEFRYPANNRAEEILDKIIDGLPVPDGLEKPKRRLVELSGIIDPAVRTEFFIVLMDRMNGYRRRDVIDLKLNRIPTEEGNVDAAEEGRVEKEVKGWVKRTTLTGESLLQSTEFRRLKQDGFCINKAVWEVIEATGDGRVFEIEALFRNVDRGTGFCYLIRGMHLINDEGEKEVTKHGISIVDKKKLSKAVEDAAYEAVLHIEARLKAAGGPIPTQ